MDFIKKALKLEKDHQKILAALLAVYIVFHLQTTDFLAPMIDTLFGKVVVVVVALTLFAHSGPLVGILGLIAAYELINRSSMTTGTYGLNNFIQTEVKKVKQMANMNNMNNTSVTLEEEVVDNMPPYVSDTHVTQASYKPILCSTKDAAPLN
jgi:hypothetical protein